MAPHIGCTSSECTSVDFYMTLATSLPKVYKSYKECHFTWDKYPPTLPNLLWKFDFFMNSPFKEWRMPRGVKKENLPTKVCVTCNRSFNWRKKWETDWENITTCSNRLDTEIYNIKEFKNFPRTLFFQNDIFSPSTMKNFPFPRFSTSSPLFLRFSLYFPQLSKFKNI